MEKYYLLKQVVRTLGDVVTYPSRFCDANNYSTPDSFELPAFRRKPLDLVAQQRRENLRRKESRLAESYLNGSQSRVSGRVMDVSDVGSRMQRLLEYSK